jgi:hypothetical protein
VTDAQTVRTLGIVEAHLDAMLLHLDAAIHASVFMHHDDHDRIFGSGTVRGNSYDAARSVTAMLREVRGQLAKLGATEAT